MPNILVLDDDPAVCGLFQKVLQTSGHFVSVAIDAPAGVDVLRCTAIDVVILDLNMPENAGLEMLSLIRREFPAMKVVLVASGYIPLPAGPLLDTVEVLSKPIGASQLRETVRRVLRSP
jgi:CheY-like chemotaxis protein